MTLIGRRYQLLDLIGSGGMGSVYRALDRLMGVEVALKQVNPPERRQALLDVTDSSALRLALAGEFRLMASLHHPNIVSVLDYGFDSSSERAEAQPFYTMDLLVGAKTLVEASAVVSTTQRVEFLVQLLQALSYLHRRRIVHRDLKPSNILVVEGRVKVLDFGLSIINGERDETAGMTVGTLAYLAPEVLAGNEASTVSDLYAVGVLAYELLAGSHPLAVRDPNRLLMQIMREYPDMLALPDHLASVVLTMLAKQPSERFQTAEHAIHALSEAAHIPTVVESIEIRESYLRTAPLVGRNAEFSALVAALQDAARGQGSGWLIGGESGVGKSRLLDEIAVQAMVQGALVVRGQGVAQGAAAYQHWRNPLRWISLMAEPSDDEIATLQLVVPDLPDRLDRSRPPAPPDGSAARGRLLSLVPALLARIEQPVVLILEDLHWSGSDSLALLSSLATSADTMRLLILASYRDDESPALPMLLPNMHLLRLDRLDDREIAVLSEAILGEPGRREGVITLLQRETEGNVFFLLEVIRALADEAGQLDYIGAVTLPPYIVAGGIQRVLQRRLERVPASARPLLNAAAAAGRQLDLGLLRSIAGLHDLDSWLATCANAAVLETSDGEWRFAHDKLRDAILDAIPADDRRALHQRIAQTLEAQPQHMRQHAAALSYHWSMANEASKSVHYTLIAGEDMLRVGVFQEALAVFERATALAAVGSPAALTALHRLQAEAHIGLGHYAEARRLLERALEVHRANNDADGLIDAHQRLGDIAYTLEAYSDAQAAYENALTLARAQHDTPRIAKALNSLGNVAFDLDQVERATELYQASLSISRAEGERWGIAGSIAHDAHDDPE